jgi:hypothetical protein
MTTISATTITAASATFTTMRSVNVTVGLRHLLRDAGDRAASAKVSNRVRWRERMSAGSCSPFGDGGQLALRARQAGREAPPF